MSHRLIGAFSRGLFFVALICAAVIAARDMAYGPPAFVREKGKPEIIKDTFLADPASGLGLVVHNADPDKEKSRIRSAPIRLTANRIFHPHDFKKGAFLLEQEVSRQPKNEELGMRHSERQSHRFLTS